MKRIQNMNGYAIYQASERDVKKYGYEAGSFYVYFSSDIRDFGIEYSDPEFEGIGTIEEARAYCTGNYARAREIVESRTTAATFEEIAEVERQLDAGRIAEDLEEDDEDEDLIHELAMLPPAKAPKVSAGRIYYEDAAGLPHTIAAEDLLALVQISSPEYRAIIIQLLRNEAERERRKNTPAQILTFPAAAGCRR